VGEQTTTWTKRSEVENKRSGIKIVQVLSPGKKKRKKKAELEKKESEWFFLFYIRRSRIITPAVCPMYKSSDTKEERERERERWVLGFGFAAAAAAGWGGAALS
jgi:hypothetical protein